MRKHAFAFVLAAAAFAASAQNAYLVKDINSTTAHSPASSMPSNFLRFGSKIVFSAGTDHNGVELFVTDGTPGGTTMIEIAPGENSSNPGRFANVNGTLVFNARDARGEELWMSDGTAAGTRLMADIRGGGSSYPGDRIVFDGRMLFTAGEAVNGRELWITDGTPAGTRFFKDLVPGDASSDPNSFVRTNGTIYFGAENGLWKSDGTEAGTVLVYGGISARSLVVAGSRLFFVGGDGEAGYEPWVSDGTAGGTHRAADVNPGRDSSVLFATLTALGDRVLFPAYDGVHGSEPWITDGTEAGTHLLVDIAPGTESSYAFNTSSDVAVLGNRAIFSARRGNAGFDLWITDGTSAGTTLLRDFTGGSAAHPLAVDDRVYFAGRDSGGDRIWITDGTTEGTRPLAGGGPGFSIGGPLAFIDGTFYFAAANRLNGYEPWKSDGTDAGTMMLKNLNEDMTPSSSPEQLFAAADFLYFSAWDGLRDDVVPALWRTDGTPEGTLLVDPKPHYLDAAFAIGRRLYFAGTDNRLWSTDGTPGGLQPATEFENRFPSLPALALRLGDKLLMRAGDRLYATTAAFGAPAVDLGIEGAAYQAMTELAGRALFFTDRVDKALWITDGTREGTHVVHTFHDSASGIVAMGGHAYFALFDSETHTTTLWRTDGTPAGTVAVTAVPAFLSPVAAGNHLFFVGEDGIKLWTSDGTAEGTRELPASVTGELAPIGGVVTFLMSRPDTGTEPWVSDGTPEGTHILKDIVQGTYGYAWSMTSAGAFAYFSAVTNEEGAEVWMTDGTSAGTRLVSDVEPGPSSSNPFSFTRAGERVYFSATTSATGKELWAIPLPSTTRITMRDVRVTESGAARFTVALHAPSTKTVTVEYTTSDGTASASSDYDAAAGTLTFAPGETVKSLDVAVRSDSAMEGNETFLVTLRNAVNAIIETPVAAAIVDDDDRAADLALVADFAHFDAVLVDVTNRGPGIASDLRVTLTAVPSSYGTYDCWDCAFVQLAPNESHRALAYGEGLPQQYVTAAATAVERDPDASNNVLAWTANGLLAMDALHLTPAANANIWIRLDQISGTYTIVSSDPNVVSAPASISDARSFVVHGLQPGSATITVTKGAQQIGTIRVDVLAPGAKMRYPDALRIVQRSWNLRFDEAAFVEISGLGSAPFTGARPTGIVRVTSNGVELARTTLLGDGAFTDIPFRLPSVGTNPITVMYEGDANFLPVTTSFEIESTRGLASASATATRFEDHVLLRVHLSGVPAAAPTGTIDVDGSRTTLTPIGPGLSTAELTLPATDAPTILLRYFGDTSYYEWHVTVPITDPRRRSARH